MQKQDRSMQLIAIDSKNLVFMRGKKERSYFHNPITKGDSSYQASNKNLQVDVAIKGCSETVQEPALIILTRHAGDDLFIFIFIVDLISKCRYVDVKIKHLEHTQPRQHFIQSSESQDFDFILPVFKKYVSCICKNILVTAFYSKYFNTQLSHFP